MEDQGITQKVRKIYKEWGLPSAEGIDDVISLIESKRKKKIEVFEHFLPKGLNGLWAPTSSRDCIFLHIAATPIHKQHILTHELSHLLLGHTPLLTGSEQIYTFLTSYITEVRGHLARSSFDAQEEQEAELMGSLLLSDLVLKQDMRETGIYNRTTTQYQSALDALNSFLADK
ncbi:MAG: hypothetical protein KF758_10990 [Anaerolineales bacterium]|nr:hypothetical protein [Anaerolineales bacterium]